VTEDEAEVEVEVESTGPRRAGSPWIAVAVFLVIALAVGGVIVAVATMGGEDPPAREARTHRYVVPAGTGDLIAEGKAKDLVPELMHANVGDTLLLVNEDDRVHVVGPFSVRPGETFEFVFPNAGVYVGACSLNAVQETKVIVSE